MVIKSYRHRSFSGFIFIIVFLALFIPGKFSLAADSAPSQLINLAIGIPQVGTGEEVKTVSGLAEYLSLIYSWAILAAAILCAVMIFFAALGWLQAGGNPSKIEKAKEKIISAIIGLILALGSYLLLYIINPNLVIFQVISPEEILPVEGDDTSVCPDTEQKVATYVPEAVELYKSYTQGTVRWTEFEAQYQLLIRKYLVPVTYRYKTASGSWQEKTYLVHQMAEPAFVNVFRSLENVDYNIARESSGGTYNLRKNRNNPDCLSYHSYAVAIDVNPSKNPNCQKNQSCYSDWRPEPGFQAVINAFTGTGFTWGGNWKSVHDYMHFEYTR